MRERGLEPTLINALRRFFKDMSLKVGDEMVKTNIGVVQGGVTSPTTFALAIDDLLRQLNITSTAYALADDIVCYCKGTLALTRTLATLHRVCRELGLSINKSKSAILQLRKGKSATTKCKFIEGYPVKRSYKYLGVLLDDQVNFLPELEKRKQAKKAIEPKARLLRSPFLSNAAKLQLWYALLRSKWWYAS